MIYADLGQYDDTLNKGTHLWSVKLLSKGYSSTYNKGGARCFKSIGVTTEKNTKMINEFEHHGVDDHDWIQQGYNSFYQGYDDWMPKTVVTVKLNCNDWTVTYYNDNKQFKKDNIEPNQSYYFALMCCDISEFTKVEVIKNVDI